MRSRSYVAASIAYRNVGVVGTLIFIIMAARGLW